MPVTELSSAVENGGLLVHRVIRQAGRHTLESLETFRR
jgi:hypothetical protein